MTPPPEQPLAADRTAKLILLFALVFPTAIAWVEYLNETGETACRKTAMQLAYGGGKAVQLALPLLFAWLCERRWPRMVIFSSRGLGLGLAFGLVVAGGALGIYFLLRGTVLFAEAAAKIDTRLAAFGLDSPGGFALFAVFIAVVHSLLEEYYWRWFVFGRLEPRVGLGWALGLSSVAFMVPHYFALASFMGGRYVVPLAGFTLCVGAGGAAWAWLFHRSGSLGATWASHFLVDLALFGVGCDLYFR